jgi:hypothetical protein
LLHRPLSASAGIALWIASGSLDQVVIQTQLFAVIEMLAMSYLFRFARTSSPK